MKRTFFPLFLALALVLGVLGQAPEVQAQSAPPTETSGEDAPGDFSFAVDIQVVTLPVTVTDPDGNFVTDLEVNDFTILDNGVQQKIESFELSLEPLSIAILVETSSRIASQLPEIRNTGILFTQLIMGELGEAAVISFDHEVKLLQDFSNNPELVEGAFSNLKPGGDPVRLSDAIARAVFMLQRRDEDRRKVIVAISEARDQGSSNPHGAVLRSAQLAGIPVYTVGLSSVRGMLGRAGEGTTSPFPPGVQARPMPGNQPPIPDAQTNWGAANVNVLALITELVSGARNILAGNPLQIYSTATGGADFSPGSKEQVEQALGRIGQELRNQYILSYRPNNLDEPGFHPIRIAVSRPNVDVRTRLGYVYARPLQRTTQPPTLQPREPNETAPSNQP